MELHIGLEDVAIAKSAISYANGEKGELIYRGFWAAELAQQNTYEEVLHLLLHGHLPGTLELAQFHSQLAAQRTLPSGIAQLIEALPRDISHMAALRSVISALHVEGGDWPPTLDQALSIFAKAPTIVAHRYSLLNGKAPVKPRADLGHIENYLYMLTGTVPDPDYAKALAAYLILCLDHDTNASTFAARVVASTQADIVSAICAAIGALIGPLHGGAPSKVDELLDEIGTADQAEAVLEAKIARGERLMGFGHRVYKTWDPRAAVLKRVAESMAGKDPLLDLSLAVEKVAVRVLEKHKPGRNLYPNVEFWAAAVLRAVGVPRELYTPTFCCTRIAGWSAHILEQAANNRLIRPKAIYVGGLPEKEQQIR
ncbi:citrate/2-methylcitrate synthase [Burkholderia vietnamiensis]|uniref:citrate/2-methylcitrate synthase n=1 Tax=Burkholderia vietnamiensis TaxID=60552 RepID=UPI00159442E7|nr:citrate/2-methylcitrate synthase [Burkholderia vietnamiensis]